MYGGDTLFSSTPAGEEFNWNIANILPQQSFLKDDLIIGYSNPGIFCFLKVINSSLSEVTLIKELELFKTKHIIFSTDENIKSLSEEEYDELIKTLLSEYMEYDVSKSKETSHNPQNIIYFGAPGTGKSYTVDQVIKELDVQYYERVTFHPDYDNASFVGGYKPITEKDKDGKDVVKYKYVAQAFAKIYTRAWKDLDNQYYLVIEEINRGNCADIFGDIFQLLDRTSDYTVTPSTELYSYLLDEFEDSKHLGIVKGLKLPTNLKILATMNTSDQSLFPMDSAFKRRWDWQYIPICYNALTEDKKENKSLNYSIKIDGQLFNWIDFIKLINNNHIKSNPSLGMDKCIGNYFVKPDKENIISLEPFISKVVFYLWNDVFKDEENEVFKEGSSYEDFFPLDPNGITNVKELFDRIGLKPNDGTSK